MTTTKDTDAAPQQPHITKYDRVAVEAVHLAVALPGMWTESHGCGYVRLDCLSLDITVLMEPWQRRKRGYCLVPVAPDGLWHFFIWPGEEDAHPGFAIGTPAHEVATYVEDEFLPQYHAEVTRAGKAKLEQHKAYQWRCDARDQVAARIAETIAVGPLTVEPKNGRWHDPDAYPLPSVRVNCLAHPERTRITIELPNNDAIACAPGLARALQDHLGTAATARPDDQE